MWTSSKPSWVLSHAHIASLMTAVISLPCALTFGVLSGVGLPTGTLLPEMKSDATHAVDVVIAYRYLSGLSLGIWME
jgi:hypothetical protein